MKKSVGKCPHRGQIDANNNLLSFIFRAFWGDCRFVCASLQLQVSQNGLVKKFHVDPGKISLLALVTVRTEKDVGS